MVTVGFIGAGNMGSAMIKGIISNNMCKSEELYVSDNNKQILSKLAAELGIQATEDNKKVAKSSDILFLAVKPQVIDTVLESITNDIRNGAVIVSIAAGITLNHLNEKAGKRKLIRVMPNLPCIVGKMAAGLAVNEFCKIEDVELVRKILESSGKVYTLEEPLLDAVTGLSGSGPAYVARLIQWFSQAGIAQGLPEDVSYGLALQTFIGTVKLLSEKGLSPQALIDQVSSPNGTTVAGMAVLENSDIPQVLSDSVKEATNRSKELGK